LFSSTAEGDKNRTGMEAVREVVRQDAGWCSADPSVARRVTRLTLAAIVVLAFALRFLHWRSLVQTEYPQLAHALIYFDMRGFLDWSDRIIGGDILGRDTFHPYHDWMRRAPIEQWYQWWGGKGIFQQEPFYPYLLALLRGVFHASIPDILLLQLMVGSLQPLVVYGLANRLFDRRVSTVHSSSIRARYCETGCRR
jgi:hypothetical protein